jgi:AAA domain
LNQDLGAFVEIIYAKKFKPQKPQQTDIAESLQLWLDTESSEDPIIQQSRVFLLNLAAAMSQRPSNLSPPRRGSAVISPGQTLASLALIRVRAVKSSLAPYEAHVKAEAKLAAALVHWLRESFGAEENIFVACPHRIQRSAVRQAILSPGEDWGTDQVGVGAESDIDALAAELEAFHVSEQGLRIDTVERLQGIIYSAVSYPACSRILGSEASFVIFLLSHTHQPSLSNHLEFLLSRRRLNVGISRAKSLCIVVSSRGVLEPSLEVLAKEDTRQGLEFLRAYEDRAWIGDIDLAI